MLNTTEAQLPIESKSIALSEIEVAHNRKVPKDQFRAELFSPLYNWYFSMFSTRPFGSSRDLTTILVDFFGTLALGYLEVFFDIAYNMLKTKIN